MDDVTLVILAGGESSRMGTPKVNLHIRGEPILRTMLNRMSWPGESMLVLAPGMENPEDAGRFTQVVRDPAAGLGPLRGILTALQYANTSSIVVMPIDMPALASEHVAWVAARLMEEVKLLGLLLKRRSADGKDLIEPFPSAFRQGAKVWIEKQLAENRRAVHSLSRLGGFKTIDAPADWSTETWTNLNTPAQHDAWEQPRNERPPNVAEARA